jgi:hypothetical protein
MEYISKICVLFLVIYDIVLILSEAKNLGCHRNPMPQRFFLPLVVRMTVRVMTTCVAMWIAAPPGVRAGIGPGYF